MRVRDPANVFAGPYVDRDSTLRNDAAWIADALAAPATRYVPVWRTRSLLRTQPSHDAVLLGRNAFASLDAGDAILLGRFEGSACFAVEIEEPAALALPPGAEFTDLRLIGGLLPPAQAGLLAYARAMLWWRHRHRHFGVCGAPTRAQSAGHVMVCTDPACATEYFPRIDPAIIVLISDGERALLGRQASWPAGVYSTIAGFVEPGESFEDAVLREVREETGVTVRDVAYHSSQPWPFPSSLMIGFSARADADAIVRTDEELEDARWVTRGEMASGAVALPNPTSISFRLIADWYELAGGRPLAEEPGVRFGRARG